MNGETPEIYRTTSSFSQVTVIELA
jgi:hypothetical protein